MKALTCQCNDGCNMPFEVIEEEYLEIMANNWVIISKKCEGDNVDLYFVKEFNHCLVYSTTEPEGEK